MTEVSRRSETLMDLGTSGEVEKTSGTWIQRVEVTRVQGRRTTTATGRVTVTVLASILTISTLGIKVGTISSVAGIMASLSKRKVTKVLIPSKGHICIKVQLVMTVEQECLKIQHLGAEAEDHSVKVKRMTLRKTLSLSQRIKV